VRQMSPSPPPPLPPFCFRHTFFPCFPCLIFALGRPEPGLHWGLLSSCLSPRRRLQPEWHFRSYESHGGRDRLVGWGRSTTAIINPHERSPSSLPPPFRPPHPAPPRPLPPPHKAKNQNQNQNQNQIRPHPCAFGLCAFELYLPVCVYPRALTPALALFCPPRAHLCIEALVLGCRPRILVR